MGELDEETILWYILFGRGSMKKNGSFILVHYSSMAFSDAIIDATGPTLST